MNEKISKTIQSVREKAVNSYIPSIKKTFTDFFIAVKKCFQTGTEKAPVLKDRILNFILKWWRLGTGFLLVFFILYYPAGSLIIHHIDINPEFSENAVRPIQTISTLANILERETVTYTFTPNKPFFHPSAFLDDMPAFQAGIISGVKNATDIFSIVNAQSETLTRAADHLSYPVSVWHIQKWKPAVSSDKKFKKAADLLKEYQKNVANEQETFNQSKEALISIIEQITAGLENSAIKLNRQVYLGSETTLDTQADDIFYNAKGEAYVYSLILRDLPNDFSEIFSDEIIKRQRNAVLFLLSKSLRILPFSVSNGHPESQIVPNHLLNSGFYLSSAASVLKDMTFALQGKNE